MLSEILRRRLMRGQSLLFAASVMLACGSDGDGGTDTGTSSTDTGESESSEDGASSDDGGSSDDGSDGTDSTSGSDGTETDDGTDTVTTSTTETATAACGDGVTDPGEECDDGNDVNTDACLDTCKNATCGDGYVHQGEEACDDGEANNDLSGPCRSDCTACDCQGTNPPGGVTCSDQGFDCGVLGCDGCNYDTSACQDVTIPNYQGVPGPEFSNEECWFPCEGYLDTAAPDDLVTQWGATCDDPEFNHLRLVCGINDSIYRYIDIDKNVFTYLLAANPELNLISDSRDQTGAAFTVVENAIYTDGSPGHPHNGASWFGGKVDCDENSASLTVNNSLCSWEVANCFGQNIAGQRYLWVYVSP